MPRITLRYDPSVARRPNAKSIKTTASRRARSPSLSDLSDDEGYSGVEDISDGEDADEKDVVAAEERHILKREPHPRSQSEDEDADDEEVEEEDDDVDDDDDDVDDELEENAHGYYEGGDDDADDDDAEGPEESVWEGISDIDEEHQFQPLGSHSPTKRTVRFSGVPSSDSESTTTDVDPDDHSDFFPDIFIEKSNLDPSFRRELDLEPEFHFGFDYEDNMLADSEDEIPGVRLFDMDDFEAYVEDNPPSQGAVQDQADGDSDSYESEGDTTEDDIPEPPPKRSPPPPIPESSESEGIVLIKRRRGKARIGRYRLDHMDKPTAVFDAKAGKMIIFTPRERTPIEESSPIHQLPFPMTLPFLPTSAHMFLGGDFSAVADAHIPSDPFFYPPTGNYWSESSQVEEEDEGNPSERELDLGDFIHWGDEPASEGEEDEQVNAYTTRPSNSGVEVDYIAHLNSLKPDKIGSFRRNQADQKLIFSERATHDSLAFSGPYNATAIRGIKSDRMGTASSPLAPVRRKHFLRGFSKTSSQSILLRKRKAPAGMDSSPFKRQRNLADPMMQRL